MGHRPWQRRQAAGGRRQRQDTGRSRLHLRGRAVYLTVRLPTGNNGSALVCSGADLIGGESVRTGGVFRPYRLYLTVFNGIQHTASCHCHLSHLSYCYFMPFLDTSPNSHHYSKMSVQTLPTSCTPTTNSCNYILPVPPIRKATKPQSRNRS